MAGRLKTLVAQSMRSIRFAARAKGEAPCTLEESLVRIRQAKVVYFGERHHNPDVLKAQLCVLLGWAERLQGHRDGPTPLTVVLEMFSLGQQRLIDAYMDRSMDMADLQRAYDEGEEGFDIENHYGALLELSRDLGVAVKAGFVPREVARLAPKDRGEFLALCQGQGWGGAGVYSDLDGPDEYFRLFRAMITGEAHGPDDARYRAFFPAQTAKDASMANVIRSCLESNSNTRVLVIAGSGHIDYGLGVPHRVNQMMPIGASPYVIITSRARDEEYDQQVADYVLEYEYADE